ncbi:D(1)-like dopamine receptor [Paramacrobiotus metropolitanus]|uniref:D(1)-like dopamine receptor n=1 Tax=Paramacrobiotus metropolitanus TaxID=2943436 RepID=UPI002445CFDC|nr:D(1)-like dopamine receptor [Paramacrobiotus metropolitanus]
MNSSLNLTGNRNATTEWDSHGSFLTFTAITLIFNVGMLVILLKDKGIQASFTVYMVGLLLSNILYTGLVNPTEILRQVHGDLWLGKRGCDLRTASEWIFSAITKHSHLLITLNRGWALVFPLSYKEKHTITVACMIFAGMIVYVLALVLPGVILDALYYRHPLSEGCGLNTDAQFTWSVVIQFVIFDFPVVFIAGSYPFLLWMHIKRKKRSIRVKDSKANGTQMTDYSDKNAILKINQKPKEKKNKSKPFVVLTLLTTGTVICWTPTMVYYTIACFTSTANMGQFFNVAIFVYSLQGLLDPVSFAFSVTWFRECLQKGWKQLTCQV